ncbi:MAG TPA: M1 family metallopeptidase [Patescibacteria group bacterium]|nr:M1 family metallopeptidase [Patescibacteria group bacterium]
MSQLFPTITPEKYTLSLRPNLETFTFSAEETIAFRTKKASKSLVFHGLEIVVEKAELFIGNTVFVPKISYDKKEHTVTFSFAKPLPAGEKKLCLFYNGLLDEKMKGWYRSEFKHGEEKHVLAVTQFEEIGGRQALVCIDEPAAKAVFDITLIIPQDLVGLSNTLEDEVEEFSDGYKRLHFVPTPRMSTYLLAFVVGKFEHIEKKTKGNILVRAFATPGKKEQLQFALDVACRSLDFYADYFNIAYPLPVLDLIAIPDFDAGAMENWGAVTFRESALLVDEQKSSLTNKQWVALVVAHELAHMWFGNLVTMEWWTHLWLNEGFACYIEYLTIDSLFPKWHMWKQFASMEHNSALALDSLASAHPIEVPITSDKEVKEIFDEISYAKGASVIQMLATYLGPKLFRQGLQKYLKDNAYGNTVTEQLWEAFEAVSHQPIREIMSLWTKKAGYPLLKVVSQKDELHVSQERFFASPIERRKSVATPLWHIPLLISHGEKNKPLLFDKKTQKIPGTGFIKINATESSVVRVVYTKEQYALLEKVLPTLDAVDRMGIVRDAFDSAKAGYASSVDALSFLPYFRHETEYVVWASIAGGLSAIDDMLFESGQEDREKFALFARQLFVPLVKKIGWKERKTDSNEDILLRSLAIANAGKYGDNETITEAKRLFADHVSGKKAIDPNLRGAVFATVAKRGNDATWSEFEMLFQKEQLQQEKSRLMMALCTFAQKNLIEKTLTWSMAKALDFQAEHVRVQDKSVIALFLFSNPDAQQITWEFIETHWDEYTKMFAGTHGFTRLIEGAGDTFSKDLRGKVAAFFKKHPTVELQMTIKQILERIDAHIDWLERDREAIENFLTHGV